MANWDEVGATAFTVPEVTAGQAHEGSPAYDVAGRQFARLRHDESRQILHFGVADLGAKQARPHPSDSRRHTQICDEPGGRGR